MLLFPGLLWKYDEKNHALESKFESWKYSTSKWIIPKDGNTGKIEYEGTTLVLGLEQNSTDEFTPVSLKTFDNSDHQMWTRSMPTTNGYFTLENKFSGKLLTTFLYIQSKKSLYV